MAKVYVRGCETFKNYLLESESRFVINTWDDPALFTYRHDFHFMETGLRLDNERTMNSRMFSLPELYKGIVWKTNPGLMYMGKGNMRLETGNLS